MKLDDAFTRLLGNEGGFQKDPGDRGNWTTGVIGQGELRGTKFGISAMAYPDEDIEGLTPARAREIYARDYWAPLRCDEMPDELRFQLFDAAVNMCQPGRPDAVVRLLQRAVGVADDGVLGPLTMSAIRFSEAWRTLSRLRAGIIKRYTGMKTFPAYGAGWLNRLANNMLED